MNKQIYFANKLGIQNSPFDSAQSTLTELKYQLQVRDKYASKIMELREKYPEQPIILIESYMYECIGCVADYVSIFTNGVLLQYTYNPNAGLYEENLRNLSVDDLIFDESLLAIKEIHEVLISGENWNHNPKKYGDEGCFDGNQTLYTVIKPENTIESMYIRCWIPIESRGE